MENPIVCPHCGRNLENNALIADAIKGEGPTKRSMYCECGERITYWQITAQLRNQKTFGYRFQSWFRGLSHSRDQG